VCVCVYFIRIRPLGKEGKDCFVAVYRGRKSGLQNEAVIFVGPVKKEAEAGC